MDQQTENRASFDQWGIVEVMGHKRFAGHITEQVLAGSALVRVDVPEVMITRHDGEQKIAGFSKLVGVGSIYCITPTSEDIARKCARELAKFDSDPLPVYIPETRQLAAVSTAGGDDFDVEEDERPL